MYRDIKAHIKIEYGWTQHGMPQGTSWLMILNGPLILS